MNVQHYHAGWICMTAIQHGHVEWTSSMDMHHGQWTCSMDQQPGHAACTVHAAWTCSMNKHHGHDRIKYTVYHKEHFS
jgi:hypothetical protein